MNLTNQVEAKRENFKKLINEYPKGVPAVMVNILKLREKTADGLQSGLECYQEYSRAVAPLLQKAGGKVLWSGKINQTIIGDDTSQPHLILLVEYPSIENFIAMATSPEYAAIARLRINALEYGGLLASSSLDKTFFNFG